MNEAIAKNLTVVIPYFNHVKYFNARIDSILQQTVKPASIIVVDDASEFGIENIINEYTDISKLPITFIKNSQNNGIATLTWLQLLKMVQTEYVWIAECDDASEIDFVEKVLGQFGHDKISVAMSASKIIDKNGICLVDNNHKGLYSRIDWEVPFVMPIFEFKYSTLHFGNPIENVGSCIFRTVSIVEAIQKSKNTMALCCDWDVYLNLPDSTYISYIPDKLNMFRVHENTQRAQNRPSDIFDQKYQIYTNILEKVSTFNLNSRIEILLQIMRGTEIPHSYHEKLKRELDLVDVDKKVSKKPKVLILRSSDKVPWYFKSFFVENRYFFSSYFEIIEIIDWWEYDGFIIDLFKNSFDLIINFDSERKFSENYSKSIYFIDFEVSDINSYLSIHAGSFVLFNVTTQKIFDNSNDKSILWYAKEPKRLLHLEQISDILDFMKEKINEKS